MNLLRLLPRFKVAQRALAELASREHWSRAQIAEYQLGRLNQLWAKAIEHVPYYRELASTQQLPKRFSRLSHFQTVVPIVDKSVVCTGQKQFLSEKVSAGKWYHSGGSTGTPTSYFRSNEAHLEILRGRYRAHKMWGVDFFDRWVFLWGHAASFAPGWPGRMARWKQPILDRLRSRLRLSAYSLGSPALRNHLQRISEFRPAAIYAYSTAAYLLAREAKATRFHCPSLKLIVLTSEPVFPHIVEACQDAFGVPTVAEYGAAETDMLAFEWPDRTLRVREDVFLVETPQRPDGRYDIVVTVLNSDSFPLIRYSIGDVTDMPLQCPENGFAYLTNVAGRHQDLIIRHTGEPMFAGWFEDILEHNDAIRRYQVHQHASGNLTVTLELTSPQASLDVTHLAHFLSEKIGYLVEITIVEVLPSTPAGKHRWVTSELAKQNAILQTTNKAHFSSISNQI